MCQCLMVKGGDCWCSALVFGGECWYLNWETVCWLTMVGVYADERQCFVREREWGCPPPPPIVLLPQQVLETCQFMVLRSVCSLKRRRDVDSATREGFTRAKRKHAELVKHLALSHICQSPDLANKHRDVQTSFQALVTRMQFYSRTHGLPLHADSIFTHCTLIGID